MRRLTIVLLVALAAILAVSGCAAPRAARDLVGGAASRQGIAVEEAPAAMPPAQPVEPALKDAGIDYAWSDEAARAAYQTDVTDDRMIIRTGNVSVVVQDTAAVLDSLSGMVKGYGGYVADSNQWYSDEQLYANLTVRIPTESLEAFLEALEDLAIRVESQNVSSDDVTEEYVDLQARLRNLEATEEELRALLTEVRENRGKAEDILAVHRELTSIRGQIESLEGRKKYLERMTALSTVHLQIRPEAAPRTVIEQRWNPLVTASNAARTLVSIVRWFLSVGIYVVVLSPLAVLPLALLWVLARVLRRRKRAGRGPADA